MIRILRSTNIGLMPARALVKPVEHVLQSGRNCQVRFVGDYKQNKSTSVMPKDSLSLFSSATSETASTSEAPKIPNQVDSLIGSLSRLLQRSELSAGSFKDSKFGGSTPVEFEKPFKHVVLVKATKNNTHVCLSTDNGRCLYTASAGMCGLKKANRGTSDAGYQVALKMMQYAAEKHKLTNLNVHLMLKGFGPGRDQAYRAIRAAEWNIRRITDTTGIRYAGCRPRKKRRL